MGPGLAPATRAAGPDHAACRRGAGRRSSGHVRHACPGAVRCRAVDRAPAHRCHGLRRPQRALGRPQPGEGVRPAGDRAPAPRPGPADVGRCVVRRAATAVAVRTGRADDGAADRRRARGDHRRPGRRGPDCRRADDRDRRAHRPVGRRPGDAGVPRDVAAVAAGALPGRRPRRAVLRAQPRSRRHVHQPAAVAVGHDMDDGSSAGRAAAPVPVRLRTSDRAALRALAQRLSHLGDRAVRVARRRARAGRGRGHCRLAARRRGRGSRRRGCPVAAVLRCVRRRRSAAHAALPGTGLGPGPRPRPGRQLPGPARRRHGCRRVAPPARRPEGRRDRRDRWAG